MTAEQYIAGFNEFMEADDYVGAVNLWLKVTRVKYPKPANHRGIVVAMYNEIGTELVDLIRNAQIPENASPVYKLDELTRLKAALTTGNYDK
tara:strand:+ start:2100 stop:2375 length:276 start_codon:yes stop_codon:yes gene_type:complete